MKLSVFTTRGYFSWRKMMTFVAIALFAYSVIGYLITYKYAELPKSYQIIIETIILSYFAKDILRNVKITNDKPDDSKEV